MIENNFEKLNKDELLATYAGEPGTDTGFWYDVAYYIIAGFKIIQPVRLATSARIIN